LAWAAEGSARAGWDETEFMTLLLAANALAKGGSIDGDLAVSGKLVVGKSLALGSAAIEGGHFAGSNFCFSGVCQACLVWDKEALATDNVGLSGVAADGTGLLGAGLEPVNGNGDQGWLRSADTYGTFALNQAQGGNQNDRFFSLAKDAARNFYAAGETNTSGAGNYDGWLVKFNAGHVQQFAVTDGGTRRDNFNRVIVLASGSVLAVGRNQIAQNGNDDGWLQKFDATGAKQWPASGGTGTSVTGNGNDVLLGVTELANGSFVAVGTVNTGSAGGTDGWFLPVSATGLADTANQKKHGTANNDGYSDIVLLGDGTFIVAGWTVSNGNNSNGWLRHLSAAGDLIGAQNLSLGGGQADPSRASSSRPT